MSKTQAINMPNKITILIGLALGAVLCLFVVYSLLTPATDGAAFEPSVPEPTGPPSYVGNSSCVSCHSAEMQLWRNSHHDKAMQHADADTVLGDFNDSLFEYNGITSRFFQRDGKYLVTTDGPDGQLRDYEIQYTFGVEPLQQYLIKLPGGRLQALSIAWDSRPAGEVGQRWFHLYPDEQINHKDPLHWTQPNQNWNYMCADCHSTNLQKNYDPKSNSYNTQWSEIDVSCEACHGPASNHLHWANNYSEGTFNDVHKTQDKGFAISFDERSGVFWPINIETGNAKRSQLKTTDKEIETCSRCHSRRGVISDQYRPGDNWLDHFQPALLTDVLYHPDGQIKDEVFVYGSFVQSKMYHEGVTCSDCHEPHSLKLRNVTASTGSNGVCLQCHLATEYDQPSHHFHSLGSAGAQCADCHMPTTNFMVIDARHDHSIRIPRPDLSQTIGTPNACTQCHQDKAPQWADQHMQSWYGKDWSPGWHFGETLYDQRLARAGIEQDLAGLALAPQLPVIARASAASYLATNARPSQLSLQVTKNLLQETDPMLRFAALQTLARHSMQYQFELGFALLTDPVRMVRIEAARLLAALPAQRLSPEQQTILHKAIQEYRQVQWLNADRPESYINLGLLEISLQQFDKAEGFYQQAIKLDANFSGAYINLADLYRIQQNDEKARQVLVAGLALSNNPDSAALHHALGLLYVRTNNYDQGLRELTTAYQQQPANARYGYVYAVALNNLGQLEKALATLRTLQQQHPTDRDILIALVSYSLANHDAAIAEGYAKILLELDPGYGTVAQLIDRLKN